MVIQKNIVVLLLTNQLFYKMKIREFILRDDCDVLMLSKENLIKTILPELYALKRAPGESGFKDNYEHTAGVLTNVMKDETELNVSMRLIAILHDIGKATTKKHNGKKYTFHNHENVSEKLAKDIFKRDDCGLTIAERENILTIIRLHGRPKAITEEGVTNSAVRRLLADAGESFYDLIVFCKYDATTKYEDKKKRYAMAMDELLVRAVKIHKQDELEKWRPPFTGNDIMEILELSQSERSNTGNTIGKIKNQMIELIKSGKLAEEREACLQYIHNLKKDTK